jgi:hypothetical protein
MALLFHTSEKDQKSILVTDTHIHLSTKKHADIASFEKSLEKKGLLETLSSHELSDAQRLSHVKTSNTVSTALNNGRNIHIGFGNEAERNSYIEHIAKLKNFKQSEEPQKPLNAAAGNLIGLGVSLVFTIVLFYMAQDMENGEEFDTTGRRSGIKTAIKMLLEAVGTIGIAAIGGLFVIYFAYQAYTVYKNPPNKVVYD